jgi:UDP-2,3-diacylglucosamine hydrolase
MWSLKKQHAASPMNNAGDITTSDFDLFISDLHLCADRPEITASFLVFLLNTATQARSLYILGDLFEYWAGDDEVEDSHHQQVILALRDLSNTGVAIFLMHGNRDFLIGSDFCNIANITLLKDPTIIDLFGTRTLLSHGDALCTDDIAYQTFRQQVRDPKWQADFLSQSLATRKQQVEAIRQRSEQEKSGKSVAIMDVNDEAVAALLKAHAYPSLLIHGHTHRPYKHKLQTEGHSITRWVLGDWYEQGSYLMCNRNGCQAIGL